MPEYTGGVLEAKDTNIKIGGKKKEKKKVQIACGALERSMPIIVNI